MFLSPDKGRLARIRSYPAQRSCLRINANFEEELSEAASQNSCRREVQRKIRSFLLASIRVIRGQRHWDHRCEACSSRLLVSGGRLADASHAWAAAGALSFQRAYAET